MFAQMLHVAQKKSDMKKFIALFNILVVAIIFSTSAFAQNLMEDVVYLKNGNIYRGLIIEQIPNVNLKIRTVGGNVFAVNISDVAKMTKEEPVDGILSTSVGKKPVVKKEKPKYEFTPRTKGYFFQSQLLLEAVQGGIRIINGYKFGRFGYLGIGVGFDNVLASVTSSTFGQYGSGIEGNYQGVYLPLYLFHQGDILNTQITPFYTVEAGYAMALVNGPLGIFDNSYSPYREGGFMGGAGFGGSFNSKRRKANFSLLFNVNMKSVRYARQNLLFTDPANVISEVLFFPGLRLGIGF